MLIKKQTKNTFWEVWVWVSESLTERAIPRLMERVKPSLYPHLDTPKSQDAKCLPHQCSSF